MGHQSSVLWRLVLQALVGQVIQALQDQQLEHEEAAGGLASRSAFALAAVEAGEDRTEDLPVDDDVQTLQGVACFRGGRSGFGDQRDLFCMHRSIGYFALAQGKISTRLTQSFYGDL